MRKILPLLVVSILVLSGLGAVAFSQDVNEEYKNETIIFSNPLINEKEKYASIGLQEATTNTMEAGKPAIPTYTKEYTFPFGTKIENVEVTFSEPLQKEVTKLVEPAPEKLIRSKLSKVNAPSEENILQAYSKIAVYPETKYSYKTGAGLKNGEHVIFLTVNLNPVQYKPSENVIYYSNSADIEVKVKLPVKPVNFGDEYDLLIITPSEFTSALQPLVDYKNDHDTATIVTTLDEINGEGVDTQEKIKYYVKEAIETWGINYLLLVGSADKFPVRYAYVPSGSYEDSFPSDLYYADIYNAEMGFSSWDKDKDGKYAEVAGANNDMSEVDMYPDVYLGKLPCNNVNEVSTVVEKIINYEEHNKVMNTIVQIGGDTFPGDPESVSEGEFANGVVLENLPGYSSTKLWDSNGQLTKQGIADAFHAGVDFADFSGHGSPLSWATHPYEDDENWIPPASLRNPYTGFLYLDYDLFLFQNKDKLPVVVFNACSTSKYTESPDCLSWKTVKKPNGGGIASFGASGIGYGSYGTHEVERVWGWMEVRIFKEIYENKGLGLSWANALNGYINSFYSGEDWDDGDYKTVLEVALFGDPSLVIEDGPDPKTRNKTINPIINGLMAKIINRFPWLEKILSSVL
jgi:hypothetical protein